MNKSNFNFESYNITKVDINLVENVDNKKEKLIPDFNHYYNIDKSNNRKVVVTLEVTVGSESGNININVVLNGIFEADSEMSDELFEKMYSMNAPAILFPYARAIISNFTLQCNIQPIIFPLVNLTK